MFVTIRTTFSRAMYHHSDGINLYRHFGHSGTVHDSVHYMRPSHIHQVLTSTSQSDRVENKPKVFELWILDNTVQRAMSSLSPRYANVVIFPRKSKFHRIHRDAKVLSYAVVRKPQNPYPTNEFIEGTIFSRTFNHFSSLPASHILASHPVLPRDSVYMSVTGNMVRSLYTLSADSTLPTIKRSCIAHAAFSHRRISVAYCYSHEEFSHKDQSDAIKAPTACLHLQNTVF
jgi:hypothetical protein